MPGVIPRSFSLPISFLAKSDTARTRGNLSDHFQTHVLLPINPSKETHCPSKVLRPLQLQYFTLWFRSYQSLVRSTRPEQMWSWLQICRNSSPFQRPSPSRCICCARRREHLRRNWCSIVSWCNGSIGMSMVGIDTFSHKSPHDTLPKATFTTACHECCIHVSEIFSYFPFYVSQI